MIYYDYNEHADHNPAGCDYRRIGLIVDLWNMPEESRLAYLTKTFTDDQLLTTGYRLALDFQMEGILVLRCEELGIDKFFIGEMSEMIRVHLVDVMFKDVGGFHGDKSQYN